MTGSYYTVPISTMILLYDYYMIHIPCLSYCNTITTPIPLRMVTDLRHFRHLYISYPEKGVFFAQILAYIHFLLYLCTQNGGRIATLMQTFVKKLYPL